jgi:hypothetical protein
MLYSWVDFVCALAFMFERLVIIAVRFRIVQNFYIDIRN